ncbi:lysophospholipid acyltransferase family protein [Granulosicoccus sp. 3-233]|uniref:lysophospholipid acyltransferase family protein n=1 Tax=Granulosicoccus sp. 3-233 TaxID=3417969 RepID=UPI003D32F966
MSVQLTRLLARILSWLPLRMNQTIGATLGLCVWALNGKLRRITDVNLDMCYPDMNEAQRRRLSRLSLMETGKQLTECAWIWHRPIAQTEQLIIDINGEELMLEARKSGKGCLFVSPHLGNWEVCSAPLSSDEPFTYFYRSPRNSRLDSELIRWRAHLRGHPASLDAGGIRRGFKILKSGGNVGILPDQEPDQANGVFAPFFGKPALTMTLLSGLARRSGATVLYCVAERLPRGKGWRLHILPADEAVSSSDAEQAATALNSGVERCIALCPEQYLWSYKRFNTTHDGSPRPYAR